MNLKQMVARVMRALPNAAPGSIGEQDIIDMLNAAQRSLAIRSNRFITYEYSLSADYSIVPFPTDLLKLVTVYWGTGDDMRELYPEMDSKIPTDNYIEEDEENSSDDTAGYPAKYYVKDKRIIIRPIPTTDDTVTIAYINRPTEMAEDDDLPELEDSEEYLIAHVLHRLHLEAGSQMFQVWERELARAEQEFIASSDQNYGTPFKVTSYW